MNLVQKQAAVQESLGPVLADCNWPTTSLPHLIWFHSSKESLDHIVQNQPGSSLVWDDWSDFGQTDLVWKQATVQESSGQLFWAGSKSRIQIRCKLALSCLLLTDVRNRTYMGIYIYIQTGYSDWWFDHNIFLCIFLPTLFWWLWWPWPHPKGRPRMSDVWNQLIPFAYLLSCFFSA